MAIIKDTLHLIEKDSSYTIRVILLDDDGVAVTGKADTDITTVKSYEPDGTENSPSIAAGDWHERGNGVYDIDLVTGEISDTAGEWTFFLDVSGARPVWRQLVVVEKSASDRVADVESDVASNLTAIETLQGKPVVRAAVPPAMFIPNGASESKVYRLWLYIFDGQGNPEAPDSIPTIGATDSEDSAILAPATMTASGDTGVYYYDYTVGDDYFTGSALTYQQLTFEFTVVENSITQKLEEITEVRDAADYSTVSGLFDDLNDLSEDDVEDVVEEQIKPVLTMTLSNFTIENDQMAFYYQNSGGSLVGPIAIFDLKDEDGNATSTYPYARELAEYDSSKIDDVEIS